MSQTFDPKVIESELNISQQLNWILDNIYQNYKHGFNALKEVLVLVKNGHNLYDKYQIDHYNSVVDSVEKNIALWENQYEMFDVRNKSIEGENYNQKEVIEAIDYQKEIIDQSLDVKPYMSSESSDACQQLQQSFGVNHCPTDNFDNEWYNNEDIYYLKSLDVMTPTSMDQIISATIRDDVMDSGFEESPLSMQNCDEINNFVLTNLCNDLEAKEELDQSYISSDSYDKIETELCPTNNVNLKKRQHNYIRKSRQVDTRIWYKCGWDGCSFGSYYNGVVKRHSYKKHSGKIKIDKSNNSAMHRFKCDWPGCEVSLVAYHKLVEHKRKHTGEKPFKCKWRACNYATARLYSMIIHERTHKLDHNLNIDYTNK